MKKFIIPPVLLIYCLISMALMNIFVHQLNVIFFPFNIAGIFVAFYGFMLMGQARSLFKKYQTTLKIDKPNCLINEGVFSKSRNPMYMGMTILLLGFAIFSKNLASVILPVLFLIIVRRVFIRKEEELLSDTFGQLYLDYLNRVPRWV